MEEHIHWSIPGYEITAELHRSHRYLVYRGRRLIDALPVVLKTTTAPFPELHDLAKLKQEYEIARKVRNPGLVDYYALLRHEDSYILVMEDFGAVSLNHYLRQRPMPLTEFFDVAIALSMAVAQLHKHGLIHKDIKLSNILIADPASDSPKVKLADLGISSLLDREPQHLMEAANRRLEGTLTYISPEQTGCINCAIDQRSDLYSLGVCFYQMLTGQAPFTAEDPLELIHQHLTRVPLMPSQLRPGLASVVDHIVMRLLAKIPKERYQSAASVADVLRHCRRAHVAGDLAHLVLDGREGRERFHISQKLYGRQREVSTLLRAFDAVCDGPAQLLLVSGYSGIGKSALVYEVQKPIVERRGQFVAGKFDQYQRNLPYASFVQAFRGLVSELLKHSPASLSRWRQRLAQALGSNARLLTELLPELDVLLGPQPEPPKLPADDAQRRFNKVVRDFLQAFSLDHPIVVFLDDLQWADPGTLALLEACVGDGEIEHVLFIGAYRDNEVHAAHPMQVVVDNIRASSARMSEIKLEPLSPVDLAALCADTLYRTPLEVEPFVKIVQHKTGGNPFFVGQLLTALYDSGDISFEPVSGTWQWDLAAIESRGFSDNVVDLMIRRIHTLPPSCVDALNMAACIGNRFDLHTLALVRSSDLKREIVNLWPALKSGLIVPLSNSYRSAILQGEEASLNQRLMEGLQVGQDSRFAFLHDRVQQAAYALIPQEELQALHLRVARLRIEGSSDIEHSKELFDVVNHYNMGLSLIDDEQERYRLARLNLAAALRTQSSSAFTAMHQFAVAARAALPQHAWTDAYDLACSVTLVCGEAEALTGQYDRALTVMDEAQSHVRNAHDRYRLAERKILFYKMKNDLNAAFATGASVLSQLGIELPRFPDEASLARELAQTEEILAGRSLTDLAELPDMDTAEHQIACRILQEIWPVGFFLGSLGIHIAAMHLVQLSARHGNCAASVFGYMVYAFAQVFHFGNIDEGYRMGQVSLKLHERFGDRAVETKILDMWGGLIQHYKEPIREGKETLWRGFIRGMEAGDYQWASYCAMNYTHLCTVGDVGLSEAVAHIDRVTPVVQKYEPTITKTLGVAREAVANLVDGKDDPVRLLGAWCDEDEILRYGYENGDISTLFMVHFYKLLLAVVFDRQEALLTCQHAMGETANGAVGIWANTVSYYLRALAIVRHIKAAEDDGADSAEASAVAQKRARLLAIVDHAMDKLRHWSAHAPINFTHMCHLITAELHNLKGTGDLAMRHYDAAITSAREHGFVFAQALAAERAARFYQARQSDTVAAVYWRQAHYCYQRWGAVAKAAELEHQHPRLLTTVSVGATTSSSTPQGSAELDSLAVVRASRAISGELLLSDLLRVLMRTVVESAGAERAWLLLRTAHTDAEVLTVEATFPAEQESMPHPLSSSPDMPHGLIQLVARSKRSILVGDAAANGAITYSDTDPVPQSDALPFAIGQDEYVRKHRPRSILCTPLIRQGHLLGVLYLENRLMPNVFTESRRQFFELLAAQAAVSIENARLYDELDQRVQARTRELQQAQERLADMARHAGMAEVAANMLHNVGNVLTGLQSSVDALKQQLGGMSFARMEKLAQLMEDDERALGPARASKNSAQKIRFLRLLAEHFDEQRTSMAGVVNTMTDEVQHISRVLVQQQEYVSRARFCKTVDVVAELEDVLAQYRTELETDGVTLKRHYSHHPEIVIEQQKLQQILSNLISNAQQALIASTEPRELSCHVSQPSATHVHIEIVDNGVGIAADDMERIFQSGFSTRQGGHGLGLHYAINAAREMGGDLQAESRGMGCGARFRLILPATMMH